MDKLIKSSRKEFDKSSYLMELRKHSTGQHYIQVEQYIKSLDKRSSILIKAENMPELLEVLHSFYSEVKSNERSEWIKLRNFEDEKLIVSFFLKGITIKDLCLAYRYEESVIIDVLIKNDITIIDGIDLPK